MNVRETACSRISIYKGLQEQHCHIWHRHSCSWTTSRSLPALFLYFHHRSFDLKLFSYNWVPTQTLKASQNPTQKGLPIFSRAKISTTASTSSLHCRCLLSKWLRCLLSARRRINITCHHVKKWNSASNTTLTSYFWLISGDAMCQIHRSSSETLTDLTWSSSILFCKCFHIVSGWYSLSDTDIQWAGTLKVLKVDSGGKYCFQGPHHWTSILICYDALPSCTQTPIWLCTIRHMEWFVFRTVSTNSYVKKDSTLYPVRQGRKAHLHFSPFSCYSHSFSFYLQTDTGVWRKHVDIVFTQWVNNNCFSPVNKMCSKLENLHWENRVKWGEQKSKAQTLSKSPTQWQKTRLSWNERKMFHLFTLPLE